MDVARYREILWRGLVFPCVMEEGWRILTFQVDSGFVERVNAPSVYLLQQPIPNETKLSFRCLDKLCLARSRSLLKAASNATVIILR